MLNKNRTLNSSGELAQARECGWELGSLACRRDGSEVVLRRVQVQTGLSWGRGGGVFPGPQRADLGLLGDSGREVDLNKKCLPLELSKDKMSSGAPCPWWLPAKALPQGYCRGVIGLPPRRPVLLYRMPSYSLPVLGVSVTYFLFQSVAQIG